MGLRSRVGFAYARMPNAYCNLPLAASPQSSSRVTVCHRISSILTSGPGSMLPTRSRVAEVSKCSDCLIRAVLSTSTKPYMRCEEVCTAGHTGSGRQDMDMDMDPGARKHHVRSGNQQHSHIAAPTCKAPPFRFIF